MDQNLNIKSSNSLWYESKIIAFFFQSKLTYLKVHYYPLGSSWIETAVSFYYQLAAANITDSAGPGPT